MCAQQIDTKQFMRDLETKSPQEIANTYQIDLKKVSELNEQLKGVSGKELESRVSKALMVMSR